MRDNFDVHVQIEIIDIPVAVGLGESVDRFCYFQSLKILLKVYFKKKYLFSRGHC